MSENGRIWGFRCGHVDDFFCRESKSETQQLFKTLKQQIQWGSWEDADVTICGVHFRQHFFCA